MRSATVEFFISTIFSDPMTTDDDDQPISLATMSMTNDVTNDNDNQALPVSTTTSSRRSTMALAS